MNFLQLLMELIPFVKSNILTIVLPPKSVLFTIVMPIPSNLLTLNLPILG